MIKFNYKEKSLKEIDLYIKYSVEFLSEQLDFRIEYDKFVRGIHYSNNLSIVAELIEPKTVDIPVRINFSFRSEYNSFSSVIFNKMIKRDCPCFCDEMDIFIDRISKMLIYGRKINRINTVMNLKETITSENPTYLGFFSVNVFDQIDIKERFMDVLKYA